MDKKLFFVGLIFAGLTVLSVLFFCINREDVHQRIKKSIFNLRSDNIDAVKKAMEYLEFHPLESLPYLMAEISNEQCTTKSGDRKIMSPAFEDFYPSYPHLYGSRVYGGDKISEIIKHILQTTCALEIPQIVKDDICFTDWQGWYYENYPYLYQDRPWLETNLLAKRCRINTLKWDKMTWSEKKPLEDKVYQEEDEKCRRVNLPIREPSGENKILIDRLEYLDRQYDKLSFRSDESDQKVQAYKDDVIKKGNDIIPELMYAYNRNLKNIFRDIVVNILVNIKTDLSNKALVRIIYDTDDQESRRWSAFYDYFRDKRDGWHKIFMSLWSIQMKNNRLWSGLYWHPYISFNPYETGRVELIRFFIDQMNTDDTAMRKHLALILWRYTKQIIIIDKNTSEMTIITNAYDQEDTETEKMIKDSYSTISPSQFQLIINKWNEWFKTQSR